MSDLVVGHIELSISEVQAKELSRSLATELIAMQVEAMRMQIRDLELLLNASARRHRLWITLLAQHEDVRKVMQEVNAEVKEAVAREFPNIDKLLEARGAKTWT